MDPEFDIAIIGMAGRFPGAGNLDEFWSNLVGGVESISRLTDEEMLATGVSPDILSRPDYVKASPVLDDPALFDASFFGFSPGEATTMDPQHRLLLEIAHDALEDAGCNPERFPGRIGVFAGSAMNTYFMNSGLNARFAEDYIPTLIVNDKDFLATRISYKLGLRGPSLTVQTACSTSLVAVHLARQSLLSEETDVALAGAVSIRVPHRAGYFYDGGGVVSPDGHVRAFDAGANGTVFGSGAGVVVLKRLADALAHGDQVYAVIKGSAVNNDGSAKAGYTAPSVDGQADVILEALANAGVSAEDISYVEAHGSGTPVGDPIEILALTKAFRNFTQKNGYCAIGSVKTNLGHLDVAAGMAGLIKTALALKHRRLPPTLHFSKPNPEIDFPATPFFVNTEAADWDHDGHRHASVMSTGMGGTNAHVILEEAPAAAHATAPTGPHLLLLSAKSSTALNTLSQNLSTWLEKQSSSSATTEISIDGRPPDSALRTPHSAEPTPNSQIPISLLSSVSYTLQTGRKFHPHRRFLVCNQHEDAIAALKVPESQKAPTGRVVDAPRPRVVFLLPGIGDHYLGMGRELYQRFETFRSEVDLCATILHPHLGLDVRDLLFPKDWVRPVSAGSPGIDLKRMLGRAPVEPPDPAAVRLDQTVHCQPALFTVEYALAQLWLELGVQPDSIVGHSMGEYVAACLAGVFSLEDALKLVAIRAKLVNALPQAAMLAVMLPEDELAPLLDEQLSISLINGPRLCVVAGPVHALGVLQNRLKEKDVIFRPVRNAHAFHSRMLDPIVERYSAELRRVRFSPPKIPFTSNVTGTWITPEQATSPHYWVEHARRTARFSDALLQLWKQPECLLVEVGPGRTLSVLATQHPARPLNAKPVTVSSLRHSYENQPDIEVLLRSIGRLWQAGAEINWEKLHEGSVPRKVSLPPYPFERQPFWIKEDLGQRGVAEKPAKLARQTDIADWFYVPSWERKTLPVDVATQTAGPDSLWLIFADDDALAGPLHLALEKMGARVLNARFGEAFVEVAPGCFQIRAAEVADYVALFSAISPVLTSTLNIVHLGPMSPRITTLDAGYDPSVQELGFYTLLNIAKAVGEVGISTPINLEVVTNQVHEVTGEEQLNPIMATVLGPCGVMPKEHPNITSFAVDLATSLPTGKLLDEVLGQLVGEFAAPIKGGVLAYRGRFRWERRFVPHRMPAAPAMDIGGTLRAQGLRHRGVYLITGGTGGIGLAIAKYLAQSCQARLVLTKRAPFPAKSTWRTCLAAGDLSEVDRSIIAQIEAIEQLGATVEIATCDVADLAGMRGVVDDAVARLGSIAGVFHAAGIIDDGLMQAKHATAAGRVLAPKVGGTVSLIEALKSSNAEFLVLFSSTAAVLTPQGQADYSAANAFLDAFAAWANAHGPMRTIAINWPGWREVGILAELQPRPGLEAWREQAMRRAITTKDGLDVFRRTLTSGLSHVLVSPEDVETLLRDPDGTIVAPTSPADTDSQPKTISRLGKFSEPVSDIECAVTEIWAGVLGVAPIGRDENFLELGGHSLLAMQIVARIRTAYQTNFTLRDFFEGPTISQMAAHVQNAILAELEGMSDEEADAQLT